MRIHFFVRSLRKDGAGSHQNAISYIRYLRERGHSITVHALTSFNNPPAGIELVEHGKETLGLIAGNAFLTHLLFAHEKNADIFFLYGVDCIWGAGAYRKNGGIKPTAVYLDTCLTTMGTGQRLSTLYYLKRVLWEKLVGMRSATWVDAYIAVSPFIKEEYVHAGFPGKKFYIVPNFFEFGTRSVIQEEHDPKVVQLLYAGRLTRDKGTDLLIAAVKDIPLEVPWRLRLVGGGPALEECKNLIQKYKLETRVEITPWVTPEKLPQIYDSADIFVHPSRCPEAFGRTFVEAMSRGLPIIASNIGAALETIGEAGIFFSNGNVRELRDRICHLAKDTTMRRILSERGIQQSQKFRKEIVGPQLENVLESIKT